MLRYWDLAANKSDKTGDEVCGMLSGYDGEELYFFKPVNDNYTASEVNKIFKKTCLSDGRKIPVRIEEEPGSGSRLLINSFQHDPDLRNFAIRGDKVKYNKVIRAHDLEVQIENENFSFISDGKDDSWIEKCVNQLVSFTGSPYGQDDIVDTMTGSARYWLKPKVKIKV